ncbi:hypothetical protein [Phytomonospora endophytica]|uniref:Uncharacterized protein n=1 Tax=Phytomonospora endophytica TaxID=714109 RepID=A0A841FUR7_9ACTN|nr:hypothetical protein [Phytomonospora endophytica]MBB6039514.1 hypothetical protein [Phytomonospora endophytica]GIG70478.1 hypothetical protein Pen01_67730 [Phytomonospora endophytica]
MITYGSFPLRHRTISVQGAAGVSTVQLVRTEPWGPYELGVVKHMDTNPALHLRPLIAFTEEEERDCLAGAVEVYRSWISAASSRC